MLLNIIFLNDSSKSDTASTEYDDFFFELRGVFEYKPLATDTMALFQLTKRMIPQETLVLINNPNYLTFHGESDARDLFVQALVDIGVQKEMIYTSLLPICEIKEIVKKLVRK